MRNEAVLQSVSFLPCSACGPRQRSLPHRRAQILAIILLLIAAATPSGAMTIVCPARDSSGLQAPWRTRTIAQVDANTRWVVDRSDLRRATSAGSRRFELGWYPEAVFFADPQYGWVVGGKGMIRHTQDGGEHWEPQDGPALANGVEVYARSVVCTDLRTCWIGLHGGALWHMDDGRTWQALADVPKADMGAVFFLDASLGWVPREDGALLKTRDGGRTWVATNAAWADATPHLVRFTDEQNGWVAADRLLYRTTDGGATWRTALTVAEGLSVFALQLGDRRAVAALEGSCDMIEHHSSNVVSRDDGATWRDVVDPRVASADWEKQVRDPRARPWTGRVSIADLREAGPPWQTYVVESQPSPRWILVARHGCGDVEVQAGELPRAPALLGPKGFDPCALDPEKANRVLAEFSESEYRSWRLVAECPGVTKRFDIPAVVPRRRLARVSPSLHALMSAADSLITSTPGTWDEYSGSTPTADEPQRRRGAEAVPLLRSGHFDKALDDPDTIRTVLAGYDGPIPPKARRAHTRVTPPEGAPLVHKVEPEFPVAAWSANVTGIVVLRLQVAETGDVRDVRVIRGIPLLDRAAEDAARQWRFAPGPPAEHDVTFHFTISECAREGLTFSELRKAR